MTASDTNTRHTTMARNAHGAAAKGAPSRADADAETTSDASAPAAPPDVSTQSATPTLRLPTIQDVWRAQDVVRPHVYHTPLLPSRTLGEMTGAQVYLKTENLQRAGSYKVRGATYKLSRLTPEERGRGVIAASAGNHAQGVAIAAAALGVACTIVMPTTAPLAKITATEGYGARVILAGESYSEAYERAREIQAEIGATYIHAFDDPDIIAGQGTVALEILSDLPDVEAIVTSIGGGGLISGIATVIKALKPDVRIYGVEASGAAKMRASLDAGHIVELERVDTIADGISPKACGPYTFAIVRDLVDDVITVDDDDIIRAMLLLMERCKLIVEGAGAAGVAALLAGKVPVQGLRTAVVLSGGNIDMNVVSRFIAHGLAIQGRYLVLRLLLPDRPGELLRLLSIIAEQNVNVLDVAHHRTAPRAPIQDVEVSLTLETRDRAHCEQLIALLRERGFNALEEQPVFNGASTPGAAH
jgi:threonine dehydratase